MFSNNFLPNLYVGFDEIQLYMDLSYTCSQKVNFSFLGSAKKLFKDYAFLLTNAERKTVSKPTDTSDSDITKEGMVFILI